MDDNTYAFDGIDRTNFDKLLEQYADVVPEKLAELEEQRLSQIPSTLAHRKSDGNPYLTKDEVATLVDWKLSHGTFRPSLKKLVQSNSEEFIKETTASAFSSQDTVDARLNTLIKLKGIGPATASLLLSTLDPECIPFFSDELFLWAFWEDKTGPCWDRKIKYTAKEYRELVAKVGELRNRLDVSALDAEKVAYVLGKREVDLSDSAQDYTEAKNGHAPNQHKRHTPSDDSAGDEKKPAAKKQKVAPRSKAPALDGTLSLRRSRRKKAG